MTTHERKREAASSLAVRFASCVVGIVFVVVAVAGCGTGQGIADRIRAANSGLVTDVEFQASFTGTGQVNVRLVPGATVAQARQLWCEIVVPAAGSELGHVHVIVLSSDPPRAFVSGVLADERVTCPTAG